MQNVKTFTYIPKPVKEILSYCYEQDIPIAFSKNLKAGSCEDACKKRQRFLGGSEKKLGEELKSLVVAYKTSAEEGIFALHCRGDQYIDFKRVKQMVNRSLGEKAAVNLLDEERLNELFDMTFGRVNPFLLDIYSGGKLLQVFDSSLLRVKSPMTTNGGEHTWGVEFMADKLIGSIKNAIVLPIAKSIEEEVVA